MPNYYEKRRNAKIKGITEDLLNQIKQKIGKDETNKIEKQIAEIKNNDELYNIIGIKEIIKLDYSKIFPNMKNFLNLDDKQKGGRVRPRYINPSVFRLDNNYNSEVEDEYIDIGEIIENNNNDPDLRIQLQEEQRLIEQEIQERNLAYQQQIERNIAYQQLIVSFQQLLEANERTTQQEIVQIIRSQQKQQQERNSMASENQNVQPIIIQDEHILNLMTPIMNSIEENYQQETENLTEKHYAEMYQEQMESIRKAQQDDIDKAKKMEEEWRVLEDELRMIRMTREEDIIYPAGQYLTSVIFKICYGCLFIIDTLIPPIFAPILLLIIIIRKIILTLLEPQQRGGKKTNKRKTKKRKSNRNKLKKNLKKKTKKVKKVKKMKSKK